MVGSIPMFKPALLSSSLFSENHNTEMPIKATAQHLFMDANTITDDSYKLVLKLVLIWLPSPRNARLPPH